MPNIDFLNVNVIQLLSNAKITFSQGGATDLQKSILLPDYQVKRILCLMRGVEHFGQWSGSSHLNNGIYFFLETMYHAI